MSPDQQMWAKLSEMLLVNICWKPSKDKYKWMLKFGIEDRHNLCLKESYNLIRNFSHGIQQNQSSGLMLI